VTAASTERGCILLDIKMPKTSGLELQTQLKGAGIDLPVIFLTAHADVPTTGQAMTHGALDVVTKPFREGALLDAVNRAIALDGAAPSRAPASSSSASSSTR
jgi:two-component system, LuxR family, response regulator FixJ